SPNKTSEKPKVPSPPPSSSNYSPSLTSNNPLMKEINDWKLEHNRKIEERKKLLEPQVLRIADDEDLLENDLEVDESDEENSYDKQSTYFHDEETLIASSNRRNLGLDEEIRSDHQKWQLTTAS
ncbi:unnamed protein product, partial [Rotaria socialis]